ncbi:MAG TPA: hypothetical protein VG498_20470 [Terriglobales bacterium]|nr:hypothetical protein [Terriglobales bacterium]
MSTVASILLFVFRPIPPVGLVAAVDLAFISAIFFWQAFFPRHIQWMARKMEWMGKAKDDPNEPARWVP